MKVRCDFQIEGHVVTIRVFCHYQRVKSYFPFFGKKVRVDIKKQYLQPHNIQTATSLLINPMFFTKKICFENFPDVNKCNKFVEMITSEQDFSLLPFGIFE